MTGQPAGLRRKTRTIRKIPSRVASNPPSTAPPRGLVAALAGTATVGFGVSREVAGRGGIRAGVEVIIPAAGASVIVGAGVGGGAVASGGFVSVGAMIAVGAGERLRTSLGVFVGMALTLGIGEGGSMLVGVLQIFKSFWFYLLDVKAFLKPTRLIQESIGGLEVF